MLCTTNREKGRFGRIWTNLEGDDQVHLRAHNRDEFGSQMARQADLRMLCVVGETGKEVKICVGGVEVQICRMNRKCSFYVTCSLV